MKARPAKPQSPPNPRPAQRGRSAASESPQLPLIFDAHLDLSMNAIDWNRDLTWPLERIRRAEASMHDKKDRAQGVVCLPEMRRGRVGLCVATLIARKVSHFSRMAGYFSQSQAWSHIIGQLEWYREMELRQEMVQIRDRKQLAEQLAIWSGPTDATTPVGYVLSLENADPIVSWRHLERAWEFGLRAIGPAHYGPGVYAQGTDATGGISPEGRDLLREMGRLGFILDATHYCEECFWQALDLYEGPIWSSHTNCRVLADWNRQYTDGQIKALVDRGAVLGVALDAIMLVSNWTWLKSRPQDFDLRLVRLVDHIDHICQLAGNARHVGIGTDLDGGYGREQLPHDFHSIADLQNLDALLADRGYKQADRDAILRGNFLGFLQKHLP